MSKESIPVIQGTPPNVSTEEVEEEKKIASNIFGGTGDVSILVDSDNLGLSEKLLKKAFDTTEDPLNNIPLLDMEDSKEKNSNYDKEFIEVKSNQKIMIVLIGVCIFCSLLAVLLQCFLLYILLLQK